MSWSEGVYDEELVVSPNAVRLGRMNSGAPLLDTHAGYSVRSMLGAVVPGTARIEAGKGVARVRLSTAPSDADVVQKIRDGIIRNISAGYVRHQIEKVEKDGATPLWRVVDWEPFEISAVPVPADAGAQFRDLKPSPCRVVVPSVEIAAARMRLRARGLAA
jgi:phage head maturation protease